MEVAEKTKVLVLDSLPKRFKNFEKIEKFCFQFVH